MGNKRFVPSRAYVKNNIELAKPFQYVYTEKLRYVLDDYRVHLMPEIKEALLKRGYILVVIGGGVTGDSFFLLILFYFSFTIAPKYKGDIQVNDTDVHSPLKAKYRQLEQELMIRQLTENPQPSRNDMMGMLDESFRSLKIDFASRFKALWVTKRVYSLAAKELIVFRNDLMEKPSPKSLKELMKMITPPKGVKRKFDKNPGCNSYYFFKVTVFTNIQYFIQVNLSIHRWY